MRMCSIASGSSGNCIYVGSDDTHLLVDTGISKKRIEEGLKTLELKGEDLDGILITHEHSDHIQGLEYSAENMRFRSMLRRERSWGSKVIPVWGKCRKDYIARSVRMNLLNWEI